MAIKSFKDMLASAKQRDSYWIEKAKLQFSLELTRFFTRSGMTQKELADKLNTSPAYITKVFRGDANFTIETMVKLSRATGGELQIHIAPEQSSTRWFDILQSQTSAYPKVGVSNEWIKSEERHSNERISTAA